MGVGSGLYMYEVVVKRSRSLSHLLMSSCSVFLVNFMLNKLLCLIRLAYPSSEEWQCNHKTTDASVCLAMAVFIVMLTIATPSSTKILKWFQLT